MINDINSRLIVEVVEYLKEENKRRKILINENQKTSQQASNRSDNTRSRKK